MNRRDFLSITAGGVVATAIPLPAVTARAANAAVPPGLQIWATAMARAGHGISPLTLRMALKVTPEQASVVMSHLQATGVIGAPNAAGVAHAAVRPAAVPKPALSLHEQMQRLARATDPLRPVLAEEGPAEAEPAFLNPSDDDSAPPAA